VRAKKLIAASLVLVVGVTALLEAQERRGMRGGYYGLKRPEHITWNSDFTFCRLAYRQAYDGDGHGWGVDYPRADTNLPIRLSELTRALVNFDETKEPNHVVIQATEPELFKCPFVMITEVGSTFFDEQEAKALREYLQKGGFMWADDFWGSYAWSHWERELRKVLPASEYPIIDVPINHSIFHTLFDAKRFPQIPSIGWIYSGTTSERGSDSATANARAVVDAKGRVLVFNSHNSDFGDSYERESDDPTYFYNFSVEGYAIGINILLYAMTH
jgi:Domain of unknown function (DUF4159)